jgi:hypothetical protein
MKRIFHTWEKWECYPAGFYDDNPPDDMTARDATHAYRDFLRDTPRFEAALERVLSEWTRSCEHYLSNDSMNRIAWLGQAAMCIETRVPAVFRGGFNLLSAAEQETANQTALRALNRWLVEHGDPELTMDSAQSRTVANLY